MSNKLDRRLRLLTLVCLMKYFCACDATCVGVLVVTKCREIPRQSPFPSFCNPIKKFLCSSSVHATPRHRQRVRRQSLLRSRIKYLRRAIGAVPPWRDSLECVQNTRNIAISPKKSKKLSQRAAPARSRADVSRRPARARVARASRASRGTSRHNPLARFRVASRARTHPSSAPVARSPVKFPRAAPSPARGAFPTVGAGFISIPVGLARVAARRRFSFDRPRPVRVDRSRARRRRALPRSPRRRARGFRAEKSTSRHVGKARRIYAYRGIDRVALMAFASAAKRATKKSFCPYPIRDAASGVVRVSSFARRRATVRARGGTRARARGVRRRGMTARATRARRDGRRDGLGRASDGARGRHRARRARTVTTVTMMR